MARAERCSQDGFQMAPGWCQHGPKMAPTWPPWSSRRRAQLSRAPLGVNMAALSPRQLRHPLGDPPHPQALGWAAWALALCLALGSALSRPDLAGRPASLAGLAGQPGRPAWPAWPAGLAGRPIFRSSIVSLNYIP